MGISNRLKQVIISKGVSNKEIAEKMGISSQSFSNALNRRDNYSVEFLEKLNKFDSLSNILSFFFILIASR